MNAIHDRGRRGRGGAGGHALRGVLCMLALVSLLSCATLDSGGAEGQSEGPSGAENGGGDGKQAERITVSGDIDFRDPQYAELLRTPPRGEAPLFFAAVPRKADRQEEYEAGIDALAAQAARWIRAQVTAKFLVKKDSTEMGYIEEIEVAVPPELQQRMREEMEVLVCYTDRSGSYLQGTIEGASPPNVRLPQRGAEQQPEWILDPPEYEGHLTAVGAANRHMYLSDSLKAADEQALANLARQINIDVEKKRLDLEQEGGSAYTQYTIQISEATLKGAYIMARWISPDGNSYYSLAVAPVRQE